MQLGALGLPQGDDHNDEYFGPQQIYHHSLSATLPVARAAGTGGQTVAVAVTYQGCAHAGLCYPPITKTLDVVLPAPGAGGGASAAAPVAGSATAAAPRRRPGRRASCRSRIGWRP